MKGRLILLTLAVMLASATVCLAQTSPQMGTWKLNEAKSRFSPGASKNITVVYETSGDDVKVIVDGVDASGGPTHNEWVGKIDGKFYPVTGDPASDERSYRKLNTRTWALAGRKAGKRSVTGTVVVSQNGKSRTVNATIITPQGKRLSSHAVYDKQ